MLSVVYLIWAIPLTITTLVDKFFNPLLEFLPISIFWDIIFPLSYIFLYSSGFSSGWFSTKNISSSIPRRIFYITIFVLLFPWFITWFITNFFPTLYTTIYYLENNLAIDLYAMAIFSFGLGFSFGGLLKLRKIKIAP